MRKTFDSASGRWEVEFSLPAEVGTAHAWVVGEWDDWDPQATPLTADADGRLAGTVTLAPDRRYRFRYYLGEGRWENDWQADEYVDNDHGGSDSVVELPPAPSPPPAATGTGAKKGAAKDKPAAKAPAKKATPANKATASKAAAKATKAKKAGPDKGNAPG